VIRTFGLTHISLAVRDLDAALRFYQSVFAPGSPYAYVNDPDGYEIEIWFE